MHCNVVTPLVDLGREVVPSASAQDPCNLNRWDGHVRDVVAALLGRVQGRSSRG
jgi:hypothetical protein